MNKGQAKQIALKATTKWSVASDSYQRHALSGMGISMDDINYELSREREARFRQDQEAMASILRFLVFSASAMCGGFVVLFVQIVDKSSQDVLGINWWYVSIAALAAGCLGSRRNKV